MRLAASPPRKTSGGAGRNFASEAEHCNLPAALGGPPQELAFTTVHDDVPRPLLMPASTFSERGALDLGDLVLRPLEAEALVARGLILDAAG
ncbi:MAG: hypothetical protein IPN34_09705 [Planctomycetes bacterium]|nr:hypothetical protein [Planctomycetota bacterium]